MNIFDNLDQYNREYEKKKHEELKRINASKTPEQKLQEERIREERKKEEQKKDFLKVLCVPMGIVFVLVFTYIVKWKFLAVICGWFLSSVIFVLLSMLSLRLYERFKKYNIIKGFLSPVWFVCSLGIVGYLSIKALYFGVNLAKENEDTSTSSVYATSSGDCYHTKDCYHIQGHRIHKVDPDETYLAPCKDCNP